MASPNRPWTVEPVPKAKWKYRHLMDASQALWEKRGDDIIWGFCFSCGMIKTFEAGSCWTCPKCRVVMPWVQIMPNFPWIRVPTSEEAIAFFKAEEKRLKKFKKGKKP
jgi:hypothetical protein